MLELEVNKPGQSECALLVDVENQKSVTLRICLNYKKLKTVTVRKLNLIELMGEYKLFWRCNRLSKSGHKQLLLAK